MSYATDGKCHNAEPGTFGHECGKPATWIGSKPSTLYPATTFRAGYCDGCRRDGSDARLCTAWERIEPTGYQDISHVTEYGLTQRLQTPVRVF